MIITVSRLSSSAWSMGTGVGVGIGVGEGVGVGRGVRFGRGVGDGVALGLTVGEGLTVAAGALHAPSMARTTAPTTSIPPRRRCPDIAGDDRG
jgi:hypothetical protein